MKECFVIMPFLDDLRPVYERIISISQSNGFKCTRADVNSAGSITKRIFESISEADVVIADLTQSNPNVFYELGISHCVGKKTILISQEHNIPFDIRNEYVIIYKNDFGGVTFLERELGRLLNYINEGNEIPNPAQLFLPKSLEEQKIIKLNELSKSTLLILAESRKVELEFVIRNPPPMVAADQNHLQRLQHDIDRIKEHIETIKSMEN